MRLSAELCVYSWLYSRNVALQHQALLAVETLSYDDCQPKTTEKRRRSFLSALYSCQSSLIRSFLDTSDAVVALHALLNPTIAVVTTSKKQLTKVRRSWRLFLVRWRRSKNVSPMITDELYGTIVSATVDMLAANSLRLFTSSVTRR